MNMGPIDSGACVVGSVSAAVIEFRVVLEQKGIVG